MTQKPQAKSEPKAEEKSEDKGKCANHPDRDATFVSDGVKHEVLRFCDECVPQHWK